MDGGGVDILLIGNDLRTSATPKLPFWRDSTLFEERGAELPLMISMTIVDNSGRNLSGQTVDAFWYSIPAREAADCRPQLFALGIGSIPRLRAHWRISPTPTFRSIPRRIANEFGDFDDAGTYDALFAGVCRAGLLNLVGGCCGTTPAHRCLPRRFAPSRPSIADRFAPISPFSGLGTARHCALRVQFYQRRRAH